METVSLSACHPLGGPLSLSRWGPSLIPSLFLPEIVQGRPAYLAEPLSLIGPPLILSLISPPPIPDHLSHRHRTTPTPTPAPAPTPPLGPPQNPDRPPGNTGP